MTFRQRRTAQKGFAIILSVGVLSLLTLIGIGFVIIAQNEQKAARNFLYGLKARYLAEAGVARAIAELRYGIDGPLNDAVDKTTDGWASGYSAVFPFSPGFRGNYTVSVVDCASRINLNDDNTNLARILKNLNSITGSCLNDTDCDNIAAGRPYPTKEAIKAVSGMTQAKYDAISPYITAYSYIDGSVVNPQDLAIQQRSPVNVNTASSQVLAAVLSGLEADKVCPNCGGDGRISYLYNDGNDLTNASCPSCDGTGNLAISSDEASNLAAYIINNRFYYTFSDLYDKLQSAQGSVIGANDADVVMANVNPNTGFSPGVRNYGWASKLGYVGKYRYPENTAIGLQTNTTEFSFNSGGYYEIASIAAVANSRGDIISEKEVTAIVKVFDIYKETTQEEFEKGTTKTRVETYPEPVGAGVTAADYDGQLMVSTVETSNSIYGTGSVSFRASFTSGFNANSSAGSSMASTNCGVLSVANASNPGELMPDGALMLNRRRNYLSYPALNNISESKGTVSMWIKPIFNGKDTMIYGDNCQKLSDEWETWYRGINRFLFQVKGAPSTNPGLIASFIYSSYYSDKDYIGSVHSLISMGKDDGLDQKNQIITTPAFGRNWKAGQWYYMTFEYEAEASKEDLPHAANEKQDYINGSYSVGWPRWENETGFDALNAFDGSSYFSIGYDRDFQSSTCPQVANAIIDEVRIWPTKLETWAISNAYNENRYSNSGVGHEGIFISQSIIPSSDPVRWGTITWTGATFTYRLPQYPSGSDLGPWQSAYTYVAVDAGSGFGSNFTNPAADNKINAESSSIRYKVTFPTVASPIHDTPVLEDVSILYLPKARILYWRE